MKEIIAIQKERKLWKKWTKARHKLAAGKITPEKEEQLFFKWKRLFVQNIVKTNNQF